MPTYTSFRYPRLSDYMGVSTFRGEPTLMEYDEVYKDPNTLRVYTKHQAEEIHKLKAQLEEKLTEKKIKLENLIAYYYKRSPNN
jgi:hypothetical protein